MACPSSSGKTPNGTSRAGATMRGRPTAAQQDRLIRQIAGREVKQLTDTQALVGTKIYYRFQLNHT